MSLIWIAPLALFGLWATVLLAFARPLIRRWREPVLKYPVLAIESDDWGAGPLAQAGLLKRLAALLAGVRDTTGHPAVMTLGVVLEVPDGARIGADGGKRYYGLPLSDARFSGIRTALLDGVAAGVFAPQLHGLCHYWPEAVMAAAHTAPDLRAWLAAPEPARTETLPAPLQSRWVDASVLPSRPHRSEAIRQAVAREAMHWRALFSVPPRVAVATTFIWTDQVEAAWHAAGIETIITPGRRATCRDATGQPGGVDRTMVTGMRSRHGLLYLVRDVYFEPARGHGPERLLAGLEARTRQGRACLVETHRANFLEQPETSLALLDTALHAAQTRHATLRFLSPEALARAIRTRDRAWIDTRLGARVRAWRARLAEIPRFARVARLTGLGWVLT